MLLLALTFLLGAEPLVPKLAATGLTTTGLDPALAGPLTDHLARAFSGIRVVTPRDISVLLGLERQKELLGCESESCIGELGNALGVQGVMIGDLVKLGSSVQINLRIIDPVTGREMASAAERVASEELIFDALTRAGKLLRAQFLLALGGRGGEAPAVPTEAVAVASGGTRRFFPILLGVAGAAVVGSVIFLVLSDGSYQRLTNGAPRSLTFSDAAAIASTGKTFQVLGAVMASLGVAAAAGGFGLLLFGSRVDPGQPSAVATLAPNGVVLAGTF